MNHTANITSSIDGPGGSRQPCNRRDRERFAKLGSAQRDAVARHAARLYDGSRTLTRCWTEALDTAPEPALDAADVLTAIRRELDGHCHCCKHNRPHMARIYALLGLEYPTAFNDDET